MNLTVAPAHGPIQRPDQGCCSLREKRPKAQDSGSLAGRGGGARLMTREGSSEAAVRTEMQQRAAVSFPLPHNSPHLPQPSTHSRVSAGMCSLSRRDFIPRPGPRLRGQVQTPPSWPQSPDRGAIRQTRTWGQHVRLARRERRTRCGGWAAGGRGAGSLRLGAGLGALHLRAGRPGPAGEVELREAAAAGATLCPAGTPRLPGPFGHPGCVARKEGRSLSPRPELLLHRLAASRLASSWPLPSACPGGLPDPGSERTRP